MFIEIAADLESQLEVISEVPAGAIRIFREPARAAAGDERCGGVLSAQSTPGSAEEGQARLSSPVAKVRSAKRRASVRLQVRLWLLLRSA